MSDIPRYRVVRCVRCEAVSPHRKTRCTRCGSVERFGALATAEEVFRARILHGAARKEIVLPRGAPVQPPARVNLWERVLAWTGKRAPELVGILRRR